jgi:hypothetical protein
VESNNDILEPRLVAVDSYTDDDASKGVIIAVRSALLANSELGSIVSEMMSGLILLPEIKVNDDE